MSSKFVPSLPDRLRELADLIEKEPAGIFDATGSIDRRSGAFGPYLATFVVRLPFSSKEVAAKAFELVVNKPPFYE